MTANDLGVLKICFPTSFPKLSLEADFVTTKPVAIEISKAGTCATRPSPIVNLEKVAPASPKLNPC